MGCFDGRCAITSLPISHYDPVYAIVYNKSQAYNANTYGMLGLISYHRRHKKELPKYKEGSFEHSVYSVTDLERFIHWQGECVYNDYGWAEIDGNEIGFVPEEHRSHNAAIDYRQKNYGIVLVHAWVIPEVLALTGKDDILYALVHFAFVARIELFTQTYGPQQRDNYALRYHELVANLITRGVEMYRDASDEEEAMDQVACTNDLGGE